MASTTRGLGPTVLSLKSRRSNDRRPSSSATYGVNASTSGLALITLRCRSRVRCYVSCAPDHPPPPPPPLAPDGGAPRLRRGAPSVGGCGGHLGVPTGKPPPRCDAD